MEYSMEERCKDIIQTCLTEMGNNPIEIFKRIADQEFIRIHGPEHHILDGAVLLTAFYNAGGKIDLESSLRELAKRGLQMPGATCGLWGVCGAVNSLGAALSIIDGTGPLSEGDSWGKHMLFTAKTLGTLGKIGGPRCCKRNAMLSLREAINYINENYDVELECSNIGCTYSGKNNECIKTRCPFYKKKIAFICVHNSCRSQIAEALGKKYLSDWFECYSAGSETKPKINQDAVRIMKELHGIDMELTQYSKLTSDIPIPDIAISMGCNVMGCPSFEKSFDDDWGLEDPTGKSDEEFITVINEIERKILELKQ